MSTKKNLAYNLVLTASNYIFPLITYPYVSRVLGVTTLGICNYVDSIIQYYILFSTLGIVSFGVREIARNSNDYEKCSKTFSNLFAINLFFTFIAGAILSCMTICLSQFEPYKPFLLIGLVKLFANLFLTEWFFQGIQKFKYITIRSLSIRILYVVSIFCFVRNADDAIIYFLLNALTIVLNACLNWKYSSKFRTFKFKGLTPFAYLAPILIFGYYRVLTSMYTTFNVVYLGATSGDTEVGYFTTATKLYTIIMSVFTAITTVMIPKISLLIHEGKEKEIQIIADQIFSALSVLSVPIIVFCQFYAEDIIYLLSGPGYEGAILPFKISITMLLVIGFEQIVIQQFLMATTSIKSIMVVSSTGAAVGLILNLTLTRTYASIGSAISWGVSEVTVLIIGLYLIKKILNLKLQYKELIVTLSFAIIYAIPLFCTKQYLNGSISFIVGVFSVAVQFIVINIFIHPNSLLISFWNGFSSRLSNITNLK